MTALAAVHADTDSWWLSCADQALAELIRRGVQAVLLLSVALLSAAVLLDLTAGGSRR